MTTKRFKMTIAGLLMLATLPQCSDDATSLYILGWTSGTKNLPLTVGQTHPMDVRLSRPVDDVTYVDINNPYTDQIEIDPASLVLKYKAAEQSQKVTIKGLQVTSGQVQIVFKLRGTNETMDLLVKVSQQGNPDFGLPPDYGPYLDIKIPPDQGVKDTGAADTAAADAASTD